MLLNDANHQMINVARKDDEDTLKRGLNEANGVRNSWETINLTFATMLNCWRWMMLAINRLMQRGRVINSHRRHAWWRSIEVEMSGCAVRRWCLCQKIGLCEFLVRKRELIMATTTSKRYTNFVLGNLDENLRWHSLIFWYYSQTLWPVTRWFSDMKWVVLLILT